MENTVYHYCSTDIFQKIVTAKTIRMSDITKSNDSMEIRWIARNIRNAFDHNWDHAYDNAFNAKGIDINTLKQLIDKFVDSYFDSGLSGDERIYKYYVACFSLEADLLSQWRGYADDGRGFSIGFDRIALEKYKEDSFDLLTVHSGFVNYSETDQNSIVETEIKRLVDSLQNAINESVDLETILQLYKSSFQNLLGESIFVKNPFFIEEKEWRLCYWSFQEYESNNDDIMIVKQGKPYQYKRGYMNRHGELVSYFDLTFDPVVIKEIVLGPKNMSDLSDINSFLKSNGINCALRRSLGSYI